MIKNLAAHQQKSTQIEENMSNLTSASNEASVSSSNRNDNGGLFSVQYDFPSPLLNQTQPQSQPAVKKKRNQPGHPDPDAEVIALSPTALLATNRFVCEICNKGFQRDQNLQLHRRGHNLPWKLKQRTNKDIIRKKVYVCPEASCVHHDPSRALGDLTGIKKHFCRKHGEKKWKCEKCSKKYAVQSDWKAHSKTCGTREYRCDCGTLFSRRDSFITHRAFCDALAEESARSITAKNTNIIHSLHQTHPPNHHLPQIQSQFNINHDHDHHHDDNHHHHHHPHHHLPVFPIKKEQQNFMMSLRPADIIPPWLSPTFPPPTLLGSTPGPPPPPTPTPSISSSPSIFHDLHQNQDSSRTHQNPNLAPTRMGAAAPLLPPYPHHPPPPPHISATALLQKAAQMGSKSSSSSPPSPACVFTSPHHHAHVTAAHTVPTTATAGFGPSRDGFINGLFSYGNKAAAVTGGGNSQQSSLFHDAMLMGNPGTLDHDQGTSAFGDMVFGGMMCHVSASKKEEDEDQESLDFHAAIDQLSRRNRDSDGMTRDFLGLRALSQSDILSIAGFGNCMDNNNDHDHALGNQEQKSWQG